MNEKLERCCDSVLMAAERGCHKCLAALIGTGADVNCQDANRRTPLMKAAWDGHDKCVKLLIQGGADVNYVNHEGMFGDTVLMEAAERGHDKCMELLIQAGADVNRQSCYYYYNKTALMKAASGRQEKCVDLLIEAGADVNITDNEGYTSLYKVGWDGHIGTTDVINCVKILLSAGATVNIVSISGARAIYFYQNFSFEKNDRIELVKLLFAAGEDIDNCLAILTDQQKAKLENEIISVEDMCLSGLCRNLIRKHMMRVSQVNLFHRVPELGLPKPLQKFLLCDVSLTKDKNEQCSSVNITDE